MAALTRLGPLEADLRGAGVPVTRIGKRHKADPFALLRLARWMRARRFDVVQTWIFAANTYGRLAARWARVPVVVTAEMAVDLWKGRAENRKSGPVWPIIPRPRHRHPPVPDPRPEDNAAR